MKSLLACAASAIALLSAASASDEVRFDLWRSSDAAQNLIAVAATGESAPFAAAAGVEAGALDILADDAASLAIADLRARSDETALAAVEGDLIDEAKGDKKIVRLKKSKKGDLETAKIKEAHKIVLVKETAADGEEVKVERRIIKLDGDADAATTEATDKTVADASAEAELLIADQGDLAKYAAADKGKIFVLEKTENGAPTRLARISGVGADSARAFIDDATGLDDAEKAAMKGKLGL